jgi:hypothetical protein
MNITPMFLLGTPVNTTDSGENPNVNNGFGTKILLQYYQGTNYFEYVTRVNWRFAFAKYIILEFSI